MEIRTICIVGAGTMGTGIAQVAAQAGIGAHLIDSSEQALARSRAGLDKSLGGAVEREKLTAAQADKARALVSWHSDFAALAEADWVVEAVFEDRAVKEQVLGQINASAAAGTPVATNTSTIPIKTLAQASGRADRFVGMHFFNPPPAMKLVEVIPGEATLPEVTRAAVDLCERMGKTPFIAPDIPGFVVNRAFGAVVTAAIDIWLSGATPEAVDTAIELGLGHRMGPLKTADLVGLDVMLALLESLHEQTADPRFKPQAELARLVAEGKLGRKSGEGFYTY